MSDPANPANPANFIGLPSNLQARPGEELISILESSAGDCELGKRYRFHLDGQNCYMIHGEGWLHITMPFENRAEHDKMKKLVDEICDAYSRLHQQIKSNNKEESL